MVKVPRTFDSAPDPIHLTRTSNRGRRREAVCVNVSGLYSGELVGASMGSCLHVLVIAPLYGFSGASSRLRCG